MKKTICIALFLFASPLLFSQGFSVPKDYKFETKEDYPRYEQDVINGINWLLETPLTREQAKRKEVNAFLMKWITGSPSVSIELRQEIVTFMDCADCLMAFLGGWTKYALETKDYSSKLKGNLAGIESVIAFYQKNREVLGKNKAIQKYIKLQKKNKLEDHIQSKI